MNLVDVAEVLLKHGAAHELYNWCCVTYNLEDPDLLQNEPLVTLADSHDVVTGVSGS